MWAVLGTLFFALLAVLAMTVIAAVFLALGTALSLVSAVSVWEATLVVMGAGTAVIWVVVTMLFRSDIIVPLESEERPAFFPTDLPRSVVRGVRRRQR